jgi:hypothetical protein
MSLTIKDFRVNDSVKSKIIRIVTPFSMHFWLAIFLIFCMYLLNHYIVSNIWTNLIYLFICFVILFY